MISEGNEFRILTTKQENSNDIFTDRNTLPIPLDTSKSVWRSRANASNFWKSQASVAHTKAIY